MSRSSSQNSRESGDDGDTQANDGPGMPDRVEILLYRTWLMDLTGEEILTNKQTRLSGSVFDSAEPNGYIVKQQGIMKVIKTKKGYSVVGVKKPLLEHILMSVFKNKEDPRCPANCNEGEFQQACKLLIGLNCSSADHPSDSETKSDSVPNNDPAPIPKVKPQIETYSKRVDSTDSRRAYISAPDLSKSSTSHRSDSILSQTFGDLFSYASDWYPYSAIAAIAVIIFAVALSCLYSQCLAGVKVPVKSAGPVCMKSDNPGNVIRDRLKSNLPDQHHMFWTHLKLSVGSAARDERPACLIIALNSSEPTKSRSSVQCVAKHSACALSGRQQIKYIEGYGRQGSHHYSDIDDELSKHFSGGNRVAVIHDIDLFDLKTAMLFYRYCDDNADPAYPSTLLLLTLSHTDPRTVSDSWITQRLTQQWSSDPDELDPILSRITGSITSINSTNMQSNMCHV